MKTAGLTDLLKVEQMVAKLDSDSVDVLAARMAMKQVASMVEL